ncbi:hypothetical protein ZOSMA_115G00350 [Zostera marina]|uniref:AAA+ ATPase domain-containing protein n=1 Tax=Zostera marina TaxID=29655 RepID=A0A0K9Q2H3_ZOSMR|nr:hypothetical protein ZOSMA_115G00350 [Zostera marina]
MDPATGAAIGSSVLELEKRAQNTIIRHVRYFTNFKNNMEEFRDQLELFEAKIDDIQNRVDVCRQNLQEPSNEVEVLLKQCTKFRVNNAGDLDNLKGLNLEGSVKYFSRYKFSKKAKDLEKKMMRLNVFNINLPMELNPPPETVVKFSTKYLEGLKSVENTKTEIIRAIKDANTVVIGLHGMGGIGKTTLMQQINNEFKEDNPHKRFASVIMVTVSDSPNIKKLQNQIGERVGLNFQGIESETDQRASRLLKRLENESILIILDDIWNELDLSTIGIPRGNGENKCCKIILTTRNRDVCQRMEASPIIRMACLNPNESWNLFESYSGTFESNPIREIAKNVCKECAGLPLAISVVASTLRHDKREYMWSNFLSGMVEHNFEELDGIEAKVYVTLKLSYDHLESHNQKLCFLFCSLFPEDYPIQLNDLMYYGLGEGFVTCGARVSSLDRILILIDKLKSRGLLLDVEGRREIYVKMHDVVRDVAIIIARNDEKLDFYSNFKDLTKWPMGGESETIKRISLMENSIRHVVDHNPKFHGKWMKSLLLNNNYSLETIDDDFFEEMGDLHILDMRGTRLKSLPTSFQKLMKLRVLAISNSYYHKARISFCDHLLSKKDLVVLILLDSRITMLTKEFGELVHLKVLDFTNTRIDIIRPNVLSKLKKLEQLRLLRSFNQWNKSDRNGNFVSFYELGSLERLYALEVEVFDEKFAMSSKEEPLNFLSSLKFFKIFLSDSNNHLAPIHYHDTNHKKILVLKSNEASKSISNWIIVLMKKAEEIQLNGYNWSKQFLGDKILENSDNIKFPLKYLFISCCKTSKVLIEFSKNKDCDAVILPEVKNIRLKELDEMENIFIIPIEIRVGSFQSLTIIFIMRCQALRSIFPWNVAVCLVHLEELYVRNCSSLEVIVIGKDNSDYYNKGQVLFPKLKRLYLYDLQNLKSLLWQQESVKRMEMELSSLMTLKVFDCMKLKRLFFGEKSAPELSMFWCNSDEWFDELQWNDEQAASRFKSIVRFDAVEGRASSRPLKTKRLNI